AQPWRRRGAAYMNEASIGDHALEIGNSLCHPIVAVDSGEQSPAELARHPRLRDEEGPARAKDTPHFSAGSPLEVGRKVMHEQGGNDHIEPVRREAQRLSSTHLELTVPGLCGLLARVADHLWRRVHTNHQSVAADRLSQQARKVAGAAAHVQNVLS